MPRVTIADLEDRIAERDVEIDVLTYEREDWQRTALEKGRLLEVAESERDFLRSIVHGLVPESLTAPGGPR